MALIKCPECGQEISSKATVCIHCGCPLSTIDEQNLVQNKAFLENKSVSKSQNTRFAKKCKIRNVIILVVVATVVVLCAFMFNNRMPNDISSELQMIIEMLSSDKESILHDFSDAVEDGSSICVSGEFADLSGIYKIVIDNDIVSRVIFERNEEISDVYEVVEDISNCLGNYDEYDSEWNKYEWETDELSIDFYVDERIYFDISDKNSIQEQSTTQADVEVERNEVRDYDDFKSTIIECISIVPNCKIYFGDEDTGSDDSYAIKVEDDIIGILGVNMENYDAVALIDDGKDLNGEYQKQISVAMIMCCDASIDYDEALRLYNEASIEDSIKIKTGVYGFKGIVNGMNAFGVDISWL